ncbi:MAG: ECF transporter S component [Candidatus Bathyarchaeia archaeon]
MARKAFSVAMAGVCAALYALIGRLTDLGITFGGVAFWPAAVIPAVFAVLFGPWVGGTGAAIGIFIRDMLFHGDALLSLSAGVTANFAGGFLIGYFARKSPDWRKIGTSMFIGSLTVVAGLLLPTVLLPAQSEIFTGWPAYVSLIVFTVAVVASIIIMTVVAKRWPEWRSYTIGSIIGLGVASLIIALVVWGYSQVFWSPEGYFKAPIPPEFMPLIFVWTFATEIPFVLLLGPPIIKACRNAFPSLTSPRKSE